nr:uncharacterized protein LOC126522496 [Dermacentor andersoni]
MVGCFQSKKFVLNSLLVLVLSAASSQKEVKITFEAADVDVHARFGVLVIADDSGDENELSPELPSEPAHGRFKRADEDDGGGMGEHGGAHGHHGAAGHTGHQEFSFEERPVVVTYEGGAGETGVPETGVGYEMNRGLGGGGGITSMGGGSRRYLSPTSGSGGSVRLGRIVYGGGGGLRPGYGMGGHQELSTLALPEEVRVSTEVA